ncbi:FAD-dependent oxidoreductase [Celeribacter indicus]|uniref:Glucose-inhibited division protein A n=1 Tax=Celeribacter indicus TaxID=1208324 RepID=A0A0B5DVS5_9RHOB|nr:FAD-binding protein [Celeribacter indicus]AJE47099.1 glucose-inhibited division protein A [Celeribacter indicus]SDW90930.1 Succinate dehydrogenase/fumarate reductase, flavoprotein subunit [Celeribacter indicus]
MSEDLDLETDVLVIGGGPAGTWAALSARRAGARVTLVDKGYCGSSGVAAASTIGHWWVSPEEREQAMADKNADSCDLAERSWMARVLAETWAAWPEFAATRGYVGDPAYRGGRGGQIVLQGPVYLKEMRRLNHRAGVTILDHAPALALLTDASGRCAGAEGVLRQKEARWRIRAGAVVLAAGGCAFKSGCLGGNVNTGDAALMAFEAGARLSGMEFSNYYGIVPKGGSVDKNGYLLQSSFFDAHGREVHRGWSSQYGVMGTGAADHFAEGPVYCQFTQVPADRRPLLRAGQPNLFIQFDRLGIDPFTQKFEVEPMFEGSVRGTGGILVETETCATAVPGLWVAGDAASREMLVGASSGAGSVNAAWTLSSGRWAGRAAADWARARGPAGPAPANGASGSAGLEPAKAAALLSALQAEVLPLHRNGFRDAAGLRRTLSAVSGLRDELMTRPAAPRARQALAWREFQAMLLFAGQGATAALLRNESRGVHRRTDLEAADLPDWRKRLVLHSAEERPRPLDFEGFRREAA